ncbi:MAG: hypothetical protein MJZ48_00690 [Paludibacteraceae bacterium]|nr:hypothetical protein [Paludibacteraceae bacterium]
MKKLFFAFMAIATITLVGCHEKETMIAGTVHYQHNADQSVKCIYGHAQYAVQFMADLGSALAKYDGAVNPNEQQMAADIQVVVNWYDKRYLLGDFELTRTLGNQTTTLATYSLQTQPAFYVYDYTKVGGSAAASLQEAVIEAVAELDEKDAQGLLTEEMVKNAMQTVYDAYKDATLTGDLVISYYDGNNTNEIAKYTFVPKPAYRVRGFDDSHVMLVKGYPFTNPFRSPVIKATDDTRAQFVMDSVWNVVNKTYYYSIKDSTFSLQKSTDARVTYSIMKTYTIERADYIIGLDSANLRSVEYSTVAGHMYEIMCDSMKNLAAEGLVYDKANVARIETSIRSVAKSYKQSGFYPDLEGTVTLFGLFKDNRQETLVTIDMNQL